MIRRLLVIAAVALIVAAGASAAPKYTVAGVVAVTRHMVTQRIAFAHLEFRYSSARCQKETPTDFFCVVTLTPARDGLPTLTLYYDVSIAAGIVSWQLQHS